MINLSSTNLSPLNLGGMNTSEIKLGYPSSGCPVPGLKGLQGFYLGKGLTNEMMSRDPIWRDKSGKGNHIALKNFGWKLDSGCGKYAQDFTFAGIYLSKVLKKTNSSIEIETTSEVWNNTVISIGSVNWRNTPTKVYISRVGVIIYAYYNNDKRIELTQGANGSIVTIPALTEEQLIDLKFLQICINGNYKAGVRLSIEQIPDYDGAICFDGVDDFGETIKDLNFTDNYSVVSLVVPFYNNRNNVIFGKDHTKDVYSNFSNQIRYYSVNRSISILADLLVKEQVRLLVCRRNKSIQEIKDIFSNRSNSAVSIPVIDNPGKYYLGRSQTVSSSCGAFAMFAHAIFDHYISDDELQILSDYWKKEFPELFPDQAWTVTGKTNSDADRATIKNITGNGNDLVLTNFAFAENSGYGLYSQDFNTWRISPGVIKTSNKITFPAGFAMESLPIANIGYNKTSLQLTLNVSGVYDNVLLFKRRVIKGSDGISERYITLKNGINKISVDDISTNNWVIAFGFTSSAWGETLANDITIEQIPDYEGYLVTDGVDDSIRSSKFRLDKDWTVVGDWEFINSGRNDVAGIMKSPLLYAYNYKSGIDLYINSTNVPVHIKVKSLRAICSDGRVYDKDWNELHAEPGTLLFSDAALVIGSDASGKTCTPLAFKNLALHNNIILTKDQCIRAYNYLQTIKNN